MTENLQIMMQDVGQHREEIINKLVQFSLTDMMFFWGQERDLIESQEKEWTPLLEWAKQEFETDFVITNGLDVPEENKQSGYRLKLFMEGLSDKELTAFYVAALNMRSVLLAVALVKGKVNAEQAFKASFLEELWQAKNWGSDEDANQRLAALKQELIEVEAFLKK